MAYSTAMVTAYLDTGFSTTNTPLNPSVMESSASASVNVGEINCLSLIGKTQGRVSVPAFSGIDKADYFKIKFSDSPLYSYWLVVDYEYLAGDTLSVSLVLDAWLSCGGNQGISSISGYVVRHTVTDDSYGKYTQDDEMLVPSQHLIFRSVDRFADKGSNKDFYKIVVSTINLSALGHNTADSMGLTYGDVQNNEYCVVPNVPKLPDNFQTEIVFGSNSYKLPAVVCFNADNADVKEGISRARSLGIEGGIIAQYNLPKEYFTIYELNPTVAGITFDTGAIYKIEPTGGGMVYTSHAAFEYAQVNNKRAIYGGLNKVRFTGMASGEEVEYSIEDLYSQSASNVAVQVNMLGDAREHGKPYFYPTYYMDKQITPENMLTCVTGMEWQNAPLRFDYGSRAGLNAVRWEAGRVIAKENMLDNMAMSMRNNYVNSITGYAGSAISGAQSIYGARPDLARIAGSKDPAMAMHNAMMNYQSAGISAGVNVLSSLGSGLINANMAYDNAKVEAGIFARNRALEKKNMMIDNLVVAPDIRFPVSEAIRDFVGNGVIVSQISPTDEDIARFDKVLNMFGYKDAGSMLSTADFTAGTYFSYIEANSVNIQCSLDVNRNIKEACERQISNGIRLWKARPDFSKYTADNRA